MSKALSDEQNGHARTFIRALVDSDFNGNITAAAKRLGVGTATLADFLRGDRGAGMKLLLAAADYTKTSVAEVTGDEKAQLHDLSPVKYARSLVGWDESIAWVRAAKGDAFVERLTRVAGMTPMPVGFPMTPLVALRLYELVEAAVSQGWTASETGGKPQSKPSK